MSRPSSGGKFPEDTKSDPLTENVIISRPSETVIAGIVVSIGRTRAGGFSHVTGQKELKIANAVFLDSTFWCIFWTVKTVRMIRMPINNECKFGGIQVISALQSNDKWKIDRKKKKSRRLCIDMSRIQEATRGPRTVIGFSSWAPGGWLAAEQIYWINLNDFRPLTVPRSKKSPIWSIIKQSAE